MNVIQNWFHKCYSKLASQTLLKITSTSVTRSRPRNVNQKQFHKRFSKQSDKRCSKLFSHTLLEIDPEVFINIGFQSLTQNRPTQVTQNWFQKCDSILLSQALLEITGMSVTQNRPIKVTQNLFKKRYSKQTHKRYSKLISHTLLKTYREMLPKIGPTSVTQNNPQTSLKIVSTSVPQNWFHKHY